MRIAVIGGGVRSRAVVYVLSRSATRCTCSSATRNSAATSTRSSTTGSRRHGIHRLERAQLPVAHAALCRARRELPAAEMSFSVSCDECGLEYAAAGRSPSGGTRRARRSRRSVGGRPLLRTRACRSTAGAYDHSSLDEYLAHHRYCARPGGTSSCRLTSALRSAAPGRTLEIPAAYAIRFFDNHGMLGLGVIAGEPPRVVRSLRAGATRMPPIRRGQPSGSRSARR